MAAGEFTPAVARRIWDRDKGCCFLCGRTLLWHERGYAWSIHHRRPRGAGGTRRVMTAANGLILCGHGTSGCHGWVERFRETATAMGLLISVNATSPEFDPSRVRVMNDAGYRFLLTDDGRAVEVEAAA